MRKTKLPKFLIAENPMADDRLFIFHSRNPRFIAEVIDDEIEVIDWIDDPVPDGKRLGGLMNRMEDWYVAYCNWKDNESHSMK